ncbi:MAG: hypothetical protein OEW62_05730 [Candidatus Bathyarchaeota archaeon]|jgi:hypothetical protein|nr:hypothetical protein [Candidatus Bathyarchaeota archaeon]MDH5734111.1 hypothetical protein [Candidatus Bathyarchaeota archaeon]
MATSMSLEKMAEWAFIIFVIVAIIAGLVVGYMAWPESGIDPATVLDTNGWILLIMLILGVIVGVVSISTKEVMPFLIAAIALITIRGEIFAPLERIHALLMYWSMYMVNYIVAFVAPAAVIIAIKQVYALAKTK